MSGSDNGRRRTLVMAVAALGAAVSVGVGTIAALGAFSATITGSGTFTAGAIVLEENGSSNNCYSAGVSSGTILNDNSYDCTSVDVFGAPVGQLAGGPANTQTLTFTNVGTSNASTFDVTPGGCTASGSGTFYGGDTSGFCDLVDVTIGNGAGTVCYFPAQASACPAPSGADTLAGLYVGGPIAIGAGLDAGSTDTINVSTLLDNSASGADMGLEATQGYTWTLSQ
jgi:hypothetical protein